MPDFYLYERDTVIHHAKLKSHPIWKERYNELVTQDQFVFENFRDHRYVDNQYVYIKPPDVINEEKKNEHLTAFAAAMIADGYTGSLKSHAEIVAHLDAKLDEAEDTDQKAINARTRFERRLLGMYMASAVRGHRIE